MKIESVKYNDKNVGNIVADLVYVSHRTHEKHLFRGGKSSVQDAIRKGTAAWGISFDLMRLLDDSGVRIIAVEADKKVYWTTLEKFQEEGNFLDMGHGLQKFLNLKHWNSVESVNRLVEALSFLKKGRK